MGVAEFLGLRRRSVSVELVERADPGITLAEWGNLLTSFSFQGLNYTLPGAKQEDPSVSFPTLARAAFKGNSVVFACVQNRIDLFSEARFMFRRLRSGRPGDLFGTAALQILNEPWPGGTTGDLLARMLLHVDLAGNSYVVRLGDRLTPLRPDWVTIIGGVASDADATVWHPEAEILGYSYKEGGPGSGKEPVVFLAEQVAHFAPKPDPEARFRGMSWITAVTREIMADKAMTEHKLSFMEQGATPNLVVKLDVKDLEVYKKWIDEFKAEHQGSQNAYKTMFFGAGADAKMIGTNLEQLEFKATQGAGETRIAAAAGVPPVVAGFSEGLQGSSLNAGNYNSSRRRFADMTMRPLWRNVSGSLARLIDVPRDAELWYDDRDISALQEDEKDAAEIQQLRAQTARTLIEAGYLADSVMQAVTNEDFTLLKHSGLFSVQLQPPGANISNDAGNGAVPALSGTEE